MHKLVSYASYNQFYLPSANSRSVQTPLVMHVVAALSISLFLLIAIHLLLSLLLAWWPLLFVNAFFLGKYLAQS